MNGKFDPSEKKTELILLKLDCLLRFIFLINWSNIKKKKIRLSTYYINKANIGRRQYFVDTSTKFYTFNVKISSL